MTASFKIAASLRQMHTWLFFFIEDWSVHNSPRRSHHKGRCVHFAAAKLQLRQCPETGRTSESPALPADDVNMLPCAGSLRGEAWFPQEYIKISGCRRGVSTKHLPGVGASHRRRSSETRMIQAPPVRIGHDSFHNPWCFSHAGRLRGVSTF